MSSLHGAALQAAELEQALAAAQRHAAALEEEAAVGGERGAAAGAAARRQLLEAAERVAELERVRGPAGWLSP